MDSVIMFCLARRSGRDGDLKFLAKRTLLLFPVYGLGAYFTQTCVFIKRTSEKAKKKFEKVFTRLHDPNVDRPFWLISYFEGTRLTKKKLAESQGFAKKRDLPVLYRYNQEPPCSCMWIRILIGAAGKYRQDCPKPPRQFMIRAHPSSVDTLKCSPELMFTVEPS
mmetsp:Transcript_34726/g.136909  ORF Transcript_34726/g.136909 Transcript_34726/m.136909 type:complete len:165 (-) Transcript_34726:4558-5052(-)